jgi:hypothetical protein
MTVCWLLLYRVQPVDSQKASNAVIKTFYCRIFGRLRRALENKKAVQVVDGLLSRVDKCPGGRRFSYSKGVVLSFRVPQ